MSALRHVSGYTIFLGKVAKIYKYFLNRSREHFLLRGFFGKMFGVG